MPSERDEQSSLSSSCLRSTRSPRRCSRCDRPLAGEVAHLPLFRSGIFCTQHCPVCRPPDQAAAEAESLELFPQAPSEP